MSTGGVHCRYMENLIPADSVSATGTDTHLTQDIARTKRSFFGGSKRTIIITVIVIVLLIVSSVVALKYKVKQDKNMQMKALFDAAARDTKVIKYDNVLPPGFPASIPVTSSSSLTQSYSKEYSNKMYQTSVVSTSSKTVYENFSYYEEFLRTDGWKIITSQKDDNKSVLFGTKEGDHLEIIIRKNKIGITYVIINVYKAPK